MGRVPGTIRKSVSQHDGRQIVKGSCTNEMATAEANALLYTLGLHVDPALQETARQRMAFGKHKRLKMHHALKRKVVAGAARAPTEENSVREWLRHAVSSTEDKPAQQATRPLVMSRSLLDTRHETRFDGLSHRVVQLLSLWHRVWATGGAVAPTWSARSGLGLVAQKRICKGRVLARGIIELDYAEPGYSIGVAGGGTLYGPASIANAACCNKCANAEFFRDGSRNDQWTLKAKDGIAAGEAILAHYPATGVCSACEPESATPREWK